jgi:hypothetical protein
MKNPELNLISEATVIREDEIKHLLEPGEVGATFELTVTDKDGKITEYHPPQKSKSFVRGFLELLWVYALPIAAPISYAIRDTSNVLHEIEAAQYQMAANTPIAVDTWGIQAGTGIVAPTVNDYALGTKILHDAAPPTAGRMQYSIMAFGAPASDATTSQFTLTRNFANASGGAITVNEIGLAVKAYRFDTTWYVLTIRDVIAGGILVPNGQTLTVNYRPQALV